jgi:hypothetical protein
MKLYQISFRWIKAVPDAPKLEPTFAGLGHWARLSAHIWFLKSNLTSQQIYAGLVPLIKSEDSVAIFEINPASAAGWAPPWFWAWVAENDTQSGGIFPRY